jgi:hypothetical protein
MDDNQEAKTNDDLPELAVIQQVEIPFLDEILLAALGADGEAYVPVTPFATRLGLGRPASQLDRIKRDDTMSECLCKMQISTPGGKQLMQCLRVDMLALWLAGIRESAVKESIRPQLKWYKKEAAKAIINHFKDLAITQSSNALVTVKTPDSQLAEVIAQYENLKAITQTVLDHLLSLTGQNNQVIDILTGLSEKQEITAMAVTNLTVRITPAQQEKIKSAVDKIVEDTPLNHAKVFNAIHQRFYVAKYEDLPCEKFEEVMTFLRQLWRQLTSPDKPEQGNLF